MLSKGVFGNKTLFISSLFRIGRTEFNSRYCASETSSCDNNSVARTLNLVETQCRSKTLNLDQALGYFDSMVKMNPLPSVEVFNHLLGALSNMNECSTVVSMYRRLMILDDLRPGISTLTVVIKCLFRLRKAGLGLSVWGTIVKSGIRPDAYVLCTLIHGFSVEGLMAAVTELLREIVERQYPCNEVTYATVINGFCKARETNKALEMLGKMGRDGEVRPNAGCFNPVIDGLCKGGQLDEALRLFQDMIGRGVQPDVYTYTSLVHGFSKSGRWLEVKSIFADMIARGVSPNVRTYTTLIHLLCKINKTQAAISIFGFMTGNGVKPDIVTFTSLISALCKSGQWEEVTCFMGKMGDYGLSPNIVIFNIMLDARCKEGSTVEALHLVKALNNKGLFRDVLSGLCDSGEIEEASLQIANLDILPDITTLNIVLNLMCNQGMMGRALLVVEAMARHGYELDTVTYNTVIKGYCLQGEMDKAKEVFDQMATLGILHDTYSYNTMADGYIRVQRICFALQVLKDLVSSGLLPDQVTRNILKNIYASRLESSLSTPQQCQIKN